MLLHSSKWIHFAVEKKIILACMVLKVSDLESRLQYYSVKCPWAGSHNEYSMFPYLEKASVNVPLNAGWSAHSIVKAVLESWLRLGHICCFLAQMWLQEETIAMMRGRLTICCSFIGALIDCDDVIIIFDSNYFVFSLIMQDLHF